jgi:UDP-2,3-diacylglucosamine pyrophosphatase LpxH
MAAVPGNLSTTSKALPQAYLSLTATSSMPGNSVKIISRKRTSMSSGILRKYSDIQVGNFMLTDKLVLEIDNKMTWIFHGDVFDNTTKGSARMLAKLGSNGYAMLILLNRFINHLLRFAGRDRISLSKKVMESVNKAVSKINDFETTAAEIAISKK